LVESLEQSGRFNPICDASETALTLWKSSKNDLQEVVKRASHYQRLIGLGQSNDLQLCFQLNTSKAVPVWDGRGFRDQNI